MSSSDDALRLDAQLCFALFSASRAMTAAYGPVLKPLGLTYPGYLVMLVLWEHGEAFEPHLRDRLTLDDETLEPLLEGLRSQGLLRRIWPAEDERGVRIELTDAGRAKKNHMRFVPTEIACQAGLTVGDERVGRLRSELHHLTATLLAHGPAKRG